MLHTKFSLNIFYSINAQYIYIPKCYIPSFVAIGLPVPEKKILKGFTIYGHGGHLGHVTSIMSTDVHFIVPESFHTKFGSDRQSSFWENLV